MGLRSLGLVVAVACVACGGTAPGDGGTEAGVDAGDDAPPAMDAHPDGRAADGPACDPPCNPGLRCDPGNLCVLPDAGGDAARPPCDPPCPAGTTCVPGNRCEAPLDGGPPDDGGCAPGQTMCPGAGCVALDTVDHCLSCAMRCTIADADAMPNWVPYCQSDPEAGAVGCTARCAPGALTCLTDAGVLQCFDGQTDRNHCGACGVRCNTVQVCAAGMCRP